LAKFRDPFLDHRKAQEQAHLAAVESSGDPMASLITVEMNITELCNRTCAFCPRVDPKIYPNRNIHLDQAISEKVASDLASFDYKGRISFSGFGEPILNKWFADHIRIFRTALSENTIETNTNGDRLTVDMINELYEAGISAIYVNMYDGPEQEAQFAKLFEEAGIEKDRYRFRPHWIGPEDDFQLSLNNRSGMVVNDEIGLTPLADALEMRCHYPFYKMLVDWNGDVLFCSNDWGRQIVVGNVVKQHVRDVWMSEEMLEVRRRLAVGDRSHSPCSSCSVHGILHGGSSFDLLMNYYTESGVLQETQPVSSQSA